MVYSGLVMNEPFETKVRTKSRRKKLKISHYNDVICCRLHNNVPMANKVSKTLRLTSLSAADDGLYKCRATNRYGKAVSSEATLTVIAGKKNEGFSLIKQCTRKY